MKLILISLIALSGLMVGCNRAPAQTTSQATHVLINPAYKLGEISQAADQAYANALKYSTDPAVIIKTKKDAEIADQALRDEYNTPEYKAFLKVVQDNMGVPQRISDEPGMKAAAKAWQNLQSEPTVTPSPTPTPPVVEQQSTPAPVGEKVDPSMEWVIKVNSALDRHDWKWITQFTIDGHTNYFGHRKVSNQYIANDISNDARRYFEGNSTYHIDTFTHEVSNEYSPSAWYGPMLYDSITVDTSVQERSGRQHQATVRFTVGYTYVNNIVSLYALTMKVL